MKKEFTDEMLWAVKNELRWHAPLVRKICKLGKINTKKYVDEITDDDACGEMTNMFLMRRDDVELIFDGVCEKESEKQFFALVVNKLYEQSRAHVSLNRIRASITDAENMEYVDVRKVYGENFDKLVEILKNFNEKYFDDSYVAENGFDESDEKKLVDLADVISSMEKSGADMIFLPWCMHYADIIYTREASKNMWEHIKKRLVEFDEVDDFEGFDIYGDTVDVCWTTEEESAEWEASGGFDYYESLKL